MTCADCIRLAGVIPINVSSFTRLPFVSPQPSLLSALLLFFTAGLAAAEPTAAVNFRKNIQPLLAKYCYDCHADGVNKGKVAFDELKSADDILAPHDMWLAALKNVRAGIMPPLEEGVARPSADEISRLAQWIKFEAFGLDPAAPDPGRVTVRRLNRVEYRNTIRELMGTEFNAEAEFPPDDTGNGFDNIGDVLTISPLLLEKYLAAAESIVDRAVPKVGLVMREISATGRDFRNSADGGEGGGGGRRGGGGGGLLSVKMATTVTRKFPVERDGSYKLNVELEARGSFDFDGGRCNLIGRADGKELFTDLIEWSERKAISHELEVQWQAGEHVVSFEVVPLASAPTVAKSERPFPADLLIAEAGEKPKAPEAGVASGIAATVAAVGADARAAAVAPVAGAAALISRRPQIPVTRLDVAIVAVKVSGPKAREFWTMPENHARFFPDGPAPDDATARDAYAAKVLRQFATRAFRRPVEDKKVAQLVHVARASYTQPGKTFEEGIGRAMMAVLASPRFLFRVEEPDPRAAKERFAPVDDYALASRLSYFLWSTMPDEELFGLAERGELRRELPAQVQRMLKDAKTSQGLVRNFTGQWLQARDIEFVPINARAVLGIFTRGRGDNAPRIDFDGPLRKFMRTETEMYFEHVLRENRSVTELIDSDYAFLNARLATHYGVPDVTGEEIRLVKLPADSPRGGILTQGTFLAVTSNPTRTSPVKRGLFVLENILGTPPPPPPPNIPDLEEAKKEFKDREPKLSEMLALHRGNALCSSCHQRMDPLGLAFENFNAMGGWRDEEVKQRIDPAGRLVTGENFKDVRELKRVLTHERRMDFYRCLTEKMLTYALGRGLDYRDTLAVDTIVDRLVLEEGRLPALVSGIIESAPFQKQRTRSAENLTVTFSPNRATVAQTESKP